MTKPKSKIGILTFSDGRQRVHEELLEMNQKFLDQVVETLEATGEVEVVTGDEIINTPRKAFAGAQKMIAENVDGTILNFSIWSFPNLAVIAARNGKRPYLLLSNLNPDYPGLVGMLASAGSLDQLGIKNSRVWGDIRDEKVLDKVLKFCRAARVVNRLRGQTYGCFGGRSMGMYTAVSELRQWQNQFGVDIEHIDQLEIVRIADNIPEGRVEQAFDWLNDNIGKIAFDENLTEKVLKYQIRCYLATKQIIKDMELDFCGIKCQPEMSEGFCTQCLSQAFLNDPYDMEEEEKEPFVCACEIDMDGALTMQILKLLSGKPILFFDFRHFDEEEGVFVYCNCGSQATWYAARSDNYKENLKKVTFYPQIPYYFKAGGATVHYLAKEGEVTMARLARRNGKYWMAIMKGEFVELAEEKMKETSGEWPHAFVKLDIDPAELISRYSSNHSHAVYGDYVDELVQVCEMLDVESVVFTK